MRKTKHIRRRDMDRVISSVAEHRKVPRTLPTGGAIYAHHYTGKVHYVAQGGGWKDKSNSLGPPAVAGRGVHGRFHNRSYGRHRYGYRGRKLKAAADKARAVADKAKAAARQEGDGWKEDQIKDHGYYTEATGKIGYGKEMQKRNAAHRKRQMEEFSSRVVDHQYDLPFERQMRAGYKVTVA